MTSLSTMLHLGESKKALKCEAKGCQRNRPGLSPLCTGHQLRKARYGHPLGNPVPRKSYEAEVKEVEEFFDEHKDHPAINSGAALFDQWLVKAEKGDSKIGEEIFKRLSFKSSSSRDLLLEVTAIWLYAKRNPVALPDDLRLTYCLSRNLCRLAGFASRPYGKSQRMAMAHPRSIELKTTGEAIRHSLARFFVNVTLALEVKSEAAQVLKEDLKKPFV